MKKFNLLYLTFFKVGKIKYAPGTAASFIACLLFFILSNIFDISVMLILTIIIFSYSFLAINNSFDQFDDEDPQEIVIDEVVGQMLTLIAIPVYETLFPIPEIYYFISAFLLFRLFDIWKPFPVSYIDNNFKGAMGIMLDDIFASFYAIIFLCVILFFLGG